MIISVASGKGGTGKTTVATNMASAIAETAEGGVQLLDCDVEAPNAHLFMHPETDQTIDMNLQVPEVDMDKCSLCKKCMNICRFRAITVVGEMVLTFPELCHSCGGCFEVCPEDAVMDAKRLLGNIETGKAGKIDFIHGRLRVGEAMSPPLINAVRSYIKPDMINIIDAPPGTSCPVVAATKNTDFVLMVTEPTPFGLHDLKLAVEAIRLLGIPHGLVINRADNGFAGVHSYARAQKINVMMEIPFSKEMARAYSKGVLIIDQMPEWKEKFSDLFEKIKTIVHKKA